MTLPGNTVPKWVTSLGRVNGEEALIHRPSLSFARIPEGWVTIQTPTDYVGLLNRETGEYRDLVWERLTGTVRVEIETPLTANHTPQTQ